MGGSSKLRGGLYAICVAQVLTSAEKQIFDFLGYMWLPILCNFLNIVFVIFCCFGVWQRKRNYIVSYIIWTVIFTSWNVFVICYYMEVGTLRRTQDMLSFGTGSFSWFLENGYGCNAEFFHNVTAIESVPDRNTGFYPIRPSKVTGCMVEYQMVETVHALIHLILALLGLGLACGLLMEFKNEVRKTKDPELY